MSNVYSEIKEALYNQLTSGLNASPHKVDVYKVNFQNISSFPAVTLELSKRGKPKKGLGVSQLEFEMLVWVYTDILDNNEAEEQCIEILDLVEKIIETDKTLGGSCMYLDIDDDVEFGTVEQGEANFLQGARLPVKIKKLIAKE